MGNSGSKLALKVGYISRPKPGKEINEDKCSFLASRSSGDGLFIVADGIGGHRAGEIASQIAVDVIRNYIVGKLFPEAIKRTSPIYQVNKLVKVPNDNDDTKPLDEEEKKEIPSAQENIFETVKLTPSELESKELKVVIKAIEKANATIYNYAQNNLEAMGMGSTATVVLIKDRIAYIGNVGDSRTYFISNDNRILRLTKDHSLVERLVDIGQLSPQEAFNFPQRNVIYRSLGHSPDIQVDNFIQLFRPGAKFILCSDGLSEVLSDEQILEVVSSTPDPRKACQKLLYIADKLGRNDDFTVIIVDITTGE